MLEHMNSISGIFADYCKSSFFGMPPWYKYITAPPNCDNPRLDKLSDLWLIGLAGIEILLRVAVLVAIIYVMLGGLKYITARGNADKLTTARTSIIDALTGLAIAIVATALVSFIAGRFTQG